MPASSQTIIVARQYDDHAGVDVPDEDWAWVNERLGAALREVAARVLFTGEGTYHSPDTGQRTPAQILVAEFNHDQMDLALDVLYRRLNASQVQYLLLPGR
jgi:hypothetical protein